MRTIWRARLAIGVLLLIPGCGSAPGPEQPATAEIRRLGGPPVEVPLDAPAAERIAKRIEAVDAQLTRWRGSLSGDPEVVVAMERVAIETREDAVAELEKALVIASSTSGPLDLLLGAAEAKVDDVREVLAADLPSSVWCRTEITAVPEDAFIHYMTEGDFADGRGEWTSYTWGDLLRIGRYRFWVTPDSAQDYKELVTVITDPKAARLQPPPNRR